MPASLPLFRLLNEFVVFLLGALLVVLALAHGLHPPNRPVVWLLLGVLLIYWGARTGMRASSQATRWYDRLRAGSLICAGLLVASLARVPARHAPLLLAIAGVNPRAPRTGGRHRLPSPTAELTAFEPVIFDVTEMLAKTIHNVLLLPHLQLALQLIQRKMNDIVVMQLLMPQFLAQPKPNLMQ